MHPEKAKHDMSIFSEVNISVVCVILSSDKWSSGPEILLSGESKLILFLGIVFHVGFLLILISHCLCLFWARQR